MANVNVFDDAAVKRIASTVRRMESLLRNQRIDRYRTNHSDDFPRYVEGILNEDLGISASAEMTLDIPFDDGTETVQVYGRFFDADEGTPIGAIWVPRKISSPGNEYEGFWRAIAKPC